MPTLYVIAGPNGVGKTTFASRYLPDEARQLEFVNADLIAKGLSPYDPEAVAVEAGKISLRRIKELIAHKVSFTWEATNSGKTAVSWLKETRAAGYLEDVSLRRFFKIIQNFFAIYRLLMDSWKLLESEPGGPRLLAVEKGGRLVVRDRLRVDQIRQEAQIEL